MADDLIRELRLLRQLCSSQRGESSSNGTQLEDTGDTTVESAPVMASTVTTTAMTTATVVEAVTPAATASAAYGLAHSHCELVDVCFVT